MQGANDWKILLIDDEPDIREVVSIVLEDAGFVVRTAENGKVGLDLCRIYGPHIVVTDIRMPEMDGLQVLERLKKEYDDIEVIVITAFGELDMAIKALQLDASDFISKPVREDALMLALKRAMDRYTGKKKLKEYTQFLEQENINQAKMLHKDKMISLGRLSASVVHEINNPLAGILNYARLMSRILKLKDLSRERRDKFIQYLDLIVSESSRLSEIVSSLLTFSRKTGPTITRLSVEELINKCILLCRHRLELGGIELETYIQEGLPVISGDFNQLQQCLINLIFNGVDAMPDGGKMTVKALYERDEHYVAIQVKDNGSGIFSQDINKIFEPFYTTKEEGYGVGLGLSILFGIMEQHNGYVDVESEPGSGTCFTLRLPA